MMAPVPDADLPIDEAIDARAPGLGPADLIFVFGTRLAEPARRAADLFERRLAPYIVVTGGAGRQLDGLNEADHHRNLLVGAGVPAEQIIVENRSTHTLENILFAVPLINQRIPNPRIVTAVVKRSHRRALVLLARHMPTIERIYAVDYEAGMAHHRLEKELRYMRELMASGIDPLVADGHGWSRAAPS